MNSIHEQVIQVLPILVELLQRADGPAIRRAETECLHTAPGRLQGEEVREVRVVHRDVVVGNIVAVRVGQVERCLGAATQPDATDLAK